MIFWCRAKATLTTLRRTIDLLETLLKDIIAKPKLTQRLLTWLNSLFISISSITLYLFINTETFLMCHINAFRNFGGVPKLVRIDNLKAAILEANFYEPVYQRAYKTMSEHYGYEIIPCRVRKP